MDIPRELKHDLDVMYKQQQVIVEKLNKVKKQLKSGNEISKAFGNVMGLVNPIQYFIDPHLLKLLKMLLGMLMVFIIIIVCMPLISGFVKLPWIETGYLVICYIGICVINYLKKKLLDGVEGSPADSKVEAEANSNSQGCVPCKC
jgi:cell division protein FtsW (lipid II flippase)